MHKLGWKFTRRRGRFESKPPAQLAAQVTLANATKAAKYGEAIDTSRFQIPPWDRSVEVSWTRQPPATDTEDSAGEAAFEGNLIRLASHRLQVEGNSPTPTTRSTQEGHVTGRVDQTAQSKKRIANAKSVYFQLPNAVRFKITKYIVQSYSHHDHDRPIRMNKRSFLRPCWPVDEPRPGQSSPTDSFESLESVLGSLHNYMSVCSAMRADVLATLFLTRRFHVVYALGVTETLQPAATRYMDMYGPLMSSITLEVDFTKLGGSWQPEAANLNALIGLANVKTLVDRFVTSQLTRPASNPLRDLRLLVRRYYGLRPDAPPPPRHSTPPATNSAPSRRRRRQPPASSRQELQSDPESTAYTPTTHLAHTLSPLKSLRPVVTGLTITGATAAFTADLLSTFTTRHSQTDKHNPTASTTSTSQLLAASPARHLQYGAGGAGWNIPSWRGSGRW
ncbi:uncharacterized protein THITE_117561 [Thermothielavioides terrestris NRRL 8126]|uniref:Uncharacterized protein n=1 Tax=Thermothielavioides terrestris (strain ATCC 38088 / NRRL 8126) TaxID=578455 RepID=G2R8B0_THETT|nr:uncharacterized protein THITE_117561 [Thermothielavioides terrestris NRRL 8126]AEO68169.1 hypothetical protein THITE_117561 [Thermothielavioides terrestris NRRL 8126]